MTLIALVVVVLIVGALSTAMSRDGEAEPSGGLDRSEGVTVTEPAVSVESDAVDTSGSSVLAMVAGFGLITVWIAGVGVSLMRARRRQRARSAQQESP